MLRLKRVLMGVLAEHGVELPIPPDGPAVRMIDQEIVRERFTPDTPADGTPEQKGEFRRKQFNRALDWAEDQQLIAGRRDRRRHLPAAEPPGAGGRHEQEDS